jgi:aminopeptidase N
MTDRINALACLSEAPGPSRDAALAEYYAANKDKPLNMLKWLAVQVHTARLYAWASCLGCLRGGRSPGSLRAVRLETAALSRPDTPHPHHPARAPQAGSGAPGNLAAVKQLLDHPAFAITNPNSCYSLFLGFARSAPNFHAKDGSGYEFLADAVLKVRRAAAGPGGGAVRGAARGRGLHATLARLEEART